MQKFSDEELVKAIVDTLFHEFASDYRQEAIDRMKDMSLTAKLLSRLERGRIAIEAMDNIGLCISVLNDFNVKYKMNNIIDIYQQSRKEATDEQCDRQS
jgi:hypothetical protein